MIFSQHTGLFIQLAISCTQYQKENESPTEYAGPWNFFAQAELQKRADRADQSVLFFLAGANFWEKHAKNCAIMSMAHITYAIAHWANSTVTVPLFLMIANNYYKADVRNKH